MLALTRPRAGAGAGTLVFDEIDAGIGGNTARTVGERLRDLGEDTQVICITHLAQVASLARPISGSRRIAARRRAATVQRLDGEGVVEEIRRMLGATTPTTPPSATLGSCSPPPERRGWPCARHPAGRSS